MGGFAITSHSSIELQELVSKLVVQKAIAIEDKDLEPQKVVTVQEDSPTIRPPPQVPQKLRKQKEKATFNKFLNLLNYVHINIPLIDVLQKVTK